MGRKFQSSFSAGELDPALSERTTLEKYSSGLKTARNVLIRKTGSILSRYGTMLRKSLVYSTGVTVQSNVRLFAFSSTTYPGHYLIVWPGHVKIFDYDHNELADISNSYAADDMAKLHFGFNAKTGRIYIFCKGKTISIIQMSGTPSWVSSLEIIKRPIPPTGALTSSIGGTGYRVDYAFTFVTSDNEESRMVTWTSASYLMVITSSTKNEFTMPITGFTAPREMKVYRRPYNGGAFGYIGSSFLASGGTTFSFADTGLTADYSHSPPDYIYDFVDDTPNVFTSDYVFSPTPTTGLIYQQRLLITGTDSREAIHASRTDFVSNFTRDYPLNAASSLSFKTGTDGGAEILRILDAGPLLLFTTQGLYSNDPGPLSPDNMNFIQRGEWIIQEDLPPLKIPGAILFVDSRTNSIVAIEYSVDAVRYTGEEISIYSSHLLRDKKITSWCFHEGDYPSVVMVLDDGTGILLSYQKEQLLRAFTPFDTDGVIKDVVSKDATQTSYYLDETIIRGKETLLLIERNGTDCLESFGSRKVSNLREYVGFDSTYIWTNPFYYLDGGSYAVHLANIVIQDHLGTGVWDGPLTLKENGNESCFGATVAGDKIRVFLDDQSYVTFTVNSKIDNYTVRATPTRLFPSDQASKIRTAYRITSQVTGLTHLAGKDVSVHVDGFVISSPLNQPEDYDVLTVSPTGVLDLPTGVQGAVIKVGLPVVNDVETLDVNTVEQKPTTLESIVATKIYLKLFLSRGLYSGQEFPNDDTVNGMEATETLDSELDADGNGPQLPYTKREEIVNPSNWDSAGRVCLRAVDGLPLEVLSIIPDFDIYRKGG